jgi:spore germination protein
VDIHVVQPGDTMYRLAQQYGAPMERLIQDNQLEQPAQLVVGQTIVVQYPALTHTVRTGDSLYSIAQMHNTTVAQLLRNNPALQGRDLLFPGQSIVVRYDVRPSGCLAVNGYAYPYIQRDLLRSILPYLSQLTPFSYRFEGSRLIPLQDEALVSAALQSRTAPLLCLANLDAQEQFSSELVHQLLSSEIQQQSLIAELMEAVDRRGYQGIDVDFEYVPAEDARAYARFLAQLRQALRSRRLPLSAALAAKTSANQPGRLYEGIDYHLIAQAVDFALLMTYDWGYLSGPPMAVAPLPQVRKVVEYALTEFSPEQLYLGIPNYGYNWPLPFREGNRAVSVNNVEAVRLAWNRHAAIRYDETAQAPWLRYVDEQGVEHEVWFEDARSIQAKLNLALEYGLYGVGYWNLDRPFPQNWVVLNSMAQIRSGM